MLKNNSKFIYIFGIILTSVFTFFILNKYFKVKSSIVVINIHEYGSRFDEKYFKEIKSFNNSGLLEKKELISLKNGSGDSTVLFYNKIGFVTHKNSVKINPPKQEPCNCITASGLESATTLKYEE